MNRDDAKNEIARGWGSKPGTYLKRAVLDENPKDQDDERKVSSRRLLNCHSHIVINFDLRSSSTFPNRDTSESIKAVRSLTHVESILRFEMCHMQAGL